MRTEETPSHITLPKAVLGFPQRSGGAFPHDLLLVMCLLGCPFALNGSICSSCRADVTEERTGGDGPGTSRISAGGAKGVESLHECLSCLYVPKDCSSCRRGELPPDVSETLIICLLW